MGMPVVKSTNGYGLAVTFVDQGGLPVEEAANGFGTPIIEVATGGLPVTRMGLVPPDSSFGFLRNTFGVSVFNKNGVISHDYDDAKSIPATTGVTYYVKPGGNDNAAGTSPATAFATLARAMNLVMFGGSNLQTQVHKIIVDTSAGDIIYTGTPEGLQALTCRKSVVIQPTGPGRVISATTVGGVAAFTWTVTANPPIYSAPCSAAPGWVIDLSRIVAGSPANKPEYEPLTLGASATTLTAGQYFYDLATTTLYVRTADGRAPDNKIIPTSTTANAFVWGPQLSGQVFWAKGIDFVGGYQMQVDYQFMADTTGRAWLNDCTFQGSGLDGFVMTRQGSALLSKCGSYNTTGDGFSAYAGAGGNTLSVSWKAELDCRARRNGNSASLANNASTGHDASISAVVNADYDLSQDRLVHYVYAALAWIIGGTLGRSARTTGSTSRTLMINQGASSRVPSIWVDSVTFNGHSEIDVEAAGYGQILFKGAIPAGLTTTTNTNGVIGTY